MEHSTSILIAFAVVNFICCGFVAAQCNADKSKHWSYDNSLPNGPVHWKDDYSKCSGSNQSPINIKTNEVKDDKNLSNLKLQNYDKPITKSIIQNNGHTVVVTPNDSVMRTLNINGVTYELKQFHFHWGSGKDDGTEHKFNDKQYALEMHLVHMDKDGKIAVIGVLFKQLKGRNTALKPVTANLDKVMYEDDSTTLNSEIDLTDLFDNECSYYRYSGSLTTPDCREGVTWTVCSDLNFIGQDQIKKFRALYSVKKSESDSKCKIINNVRPTQPCNGRTVMSTP